MFALTASNGGVFVAQIRQFGSRGSVDNLYVEAEYQASYATFGRFSIAAATSWMRRISFVQSPKCQSTPSKKPSSYSVKSSEVSHNARSSSRFCYILYQRPACLKITFAQYSDAIAVCPRCAGTILMLRILLIVQLNVVSDSLDRDISAT